MRHRKPLRYVAGVVIAAAVLIGCSDDTSPPAPAAEPTAVPVAPRATSDVTVSDAVPSAQELEELGLTGEQADCFVAAVDPDGTGRISDANLFATAWAECLGTFAGDG